MYVYICNKKTKRPWMRKSGGTLEELEGREGEGINVKQYSTYMKFSINEKYFKNPE